MKKVVAIHAGPRANHNTDQLIHSAIEAIESQEIEVTYIDLFKLEKYTGCVSCFGCKTEKSYGKCVYHDGLYDVLNQIRQADGLIIGSPNYLGNFTASFRALYERLIFQSLTYNKETPNCNQHMIPVLLIMTSNCANEMYDAVGYTQLLENYKQTFNNFVGPTQIFAVGNTLQVEDYGRYNWTMFDGDAKKAYHDTHFQASLDKAYQEGLLLANQIKNGE